MKVKIWLSGAIPTPQKRNRFYLLTHCFSSSVVRAHEMANIPMFIKR